MNFSRGRFFLFPEALEEHDESSRMPVCTWVCALSFGRCRMSKFWLLVYLEFFESLRPALFALYNCTINQKRLIEPIMGSRARPVASALCRLDSKSDECAQTSRPRTHA